MSANATIALAGNPNVGKSTIFNALTGSQQHVGNWPGKTVEQKRGITRIKDREITVVDLPGTYSLSAYSAEEIIARDFIVNERPNLVVTVVDASNPERNLYLVAQLLELSVPVIVALNMSDVAQSRGLRIDVAALSARLGGVPIIETVGNRSDGIEVLKQAIFELIARPQTATFTQTTFGEPLAGEIKALQTQIEADESLCPDYHPRWLAIKLLEADEDIDAKLEAAGHTKLIEMAKAAIARVDEATGEDAETLIANERYLFVGEVVKDAIARPDAAVETFSDKIDRVLTHRIWGVPIFLLMMWGVFQVTANVSVPLLDWVDGVFGGPVTHWAISILGVLGLGGTWVESLIVDGVIAGVGGVLVFIPVLFSLYFVITSLEESGYMARAAFVMDRFMQKLGLHGKSFLPMIVGFGCTVPAIYATRTLEDEQDRKITGFLTTFMSCGARLPVYVIFGTAFFGKASGNLVFAMYLTGIVVAILTSLLLTRIVFRGKPVQPFVMELPPYRAPTLKSIWTPIRTRTTEFVRNAGTVILAMSVVIWFLMAIPANAEAGNFTEVAPADSLFGTLSRAIAPVLAPAGFDSWEASGSLVTGFMAKEIVISSMSQIYVGAANEEPVAETSTLGEDLQVILTTFGEAAILTTQELVNVIPRTINVIPGVTIPEADLLGSAEAERDTALEAALRGAFTPLAAVAFNVFVLLYTPCMASLGAMRHEFGTRWALYQAIYTLALAWVAAVIVYQGGLLLGLG